MKKELFGNNGESITYGFLGYPVSQAADITAFNGAPLPSRPFTLVVVLKTCSGSVRVSP